MELIEISNEEYTSLVNAKANIYVSGDFLSLNSYKISRVHYLLFKDKKNRFAFSIAENENHEWLAPFSAPFSTLVELRKEIELRYYWEFYASLVDYVKEHGGKRIDIYLAPDLYGAEHNAKVESAMLGAGFLQDYQELNYSLDLNKFSKNNYITYLHHNAKKNLNISLSKGLEFEKCITVEDKKKAYDIIAINRKSKGYYLAMSWDQVKETINLVKHDFFLVKVNGLYIASAIVFWVNEEICQVVYWGDIPEQSEFKPINFLAYCLVNYYTNEGATVIDIGPSSKYGEPNFGLCKFKESIGCDVSSKRHYSIVFKE
ncbi:hypothetical protein NXH64_04750 [Butyrivibrio fibrisolvens]|uniref:hypothetical protein n=1 Tax=Pseudobutyrivibrio ruminis TaxID=46206 RepID=UPI0003F7AE5B|nr:hypothetical protein [Pseudobutyrivibrio ruminis]MDC7278810.1 hypothetical protein [Butyrivibrio fibrisolvens]